MSILPFCASLLFGFASGTASLFASELKTDSVWQGPAKDTRAALPTAQERAAIRKDVVNVYEDVLRSSDREVREEGARTLLAEGIAEGNSLKQRFVLLTVAREIAERDGHCQLVCESLDELGKHFQVNAQALKLQSLTNIGNAGTAAVEDVIPKLAEFGLACVVVDLPAAQKALDAAALMLRRHSDSGTAAAALRDLLALQVDGLRKAIIAHEGSARLARAAVPKEDDLAVAREKLQPELDGLKELFKKNDAENLAERLLRSAQDPRNPPALRMEAIRASMVVAEQFGDAHGVALAVDEMAYQFEVSAEQQLFDAATRMVEAGRPCREEDFAGMFLKVAGVALVSNVALARKAIDSAQKHADRLRGMNLYIALNKTCSQVQEAVAEAELFVELQTAVAKNPVDKQAAHKLGWFLCVRRERWSEGLPLLEKGEVWPMGILAMQEMASKINAEEGLKIADEWWGLAEDQSTEARDRRAMYRHAHEWYRKVQPEITDFRLALIKKRLATKSDEEEDDGEAGASTSKPSKPSAMRVRGAHGPSNRAVDSALVWLQKHQDEGGAWDCDDFHKHDPQKDRCDGPGNAVHDVGVTGLALLAFMEAGSTTHSGPYRDEVTKGVLWLLSRQAESGLIGGNASHDFIYDHAIAANALCKAHALSRNAFWENCAQKSIDYLEVHRNPLSVWRYQPRDKDNDISVTGWAISAYVIAKHAGLDVNQKAFELAADFLDQVSDVTGKHGYTKSGEGSSRRPGDHGTKFPIERIETLTAVGLACRQLLGQSGRPVMTAAAQRISDKPPEWDERSGTIDFYYWYYGSKAMQGMGAAWANAWRGRLRTALLSNQNTKGSAAGSWDPVGAWSEDGGRVYSTAVMCLALIAMNK